MGSTERIEAMCDEFYDLCSTPYNNALKAYKEEGGRIVGTLYNQVPEELLTAAGLRQRPFA